MDKITCLAASNKISLVFGYIGVSFYLLYVYAGWWMFFCALIGGLIQLCSYIFCFMDSKIRIDITQVNKQIKLLKKDTYIVPFHCIILCLLNLFPIAVSLFSIPFPYWGGLYFKVEYEGGVIVTLIALFIIFFYICCCLVRFDSCKTAIKELKEEAQYYNIHGISHQKSIREKEREIEKEKKNKLKLLYGEDYKVLSYDPSQPECKIIYSNKEKKITIHGIEYKYSEIEKCSIVVDKSLTVEMPGTETYKTKTNTGSMLKRAVVGGVLTGGVGAIIGAATAKKETIKVSEPSKTVILGDYAVRIYLKNKKIPIEIKKIKTFHLAKSIENCINRIMEREREGSYTKTKENEKSYNKYSDAEALDRLVELKKKESLTEEEQKEYDVLRKRLIEII